MPCRSYPCQSRLPLVHVPAVGSPRRHVTLLTFFIHCRILGKLLSDNRVRRPGGRPGDWRSRPKSLSASVGKGEYHHGWLATTCHWLLQCVRTHGAGPWRLRPCPEPPAYTTRLTTATFLMAGRAPRIRTRAQADPRSALRSGPTKPGALLPACNGGARYASISPRWSGYLPVRPCVLL